MKKTIIFSILSVFLFIFFIEFSSRIFVFAMSKNSDIFKYGYNKYIELQVRKLSKFNFEVVNNELTSINLSNKSINSDIWVFGGSTSDVACRKENNISWPYQLNIDYKKTFNFAKSGTNSDFALNSLIASVNSGNLAKKILWANFANETDVIFFGFKKNPHLSKEIKINTKINKLVYFTKSLQISLKNYSVAFYLLDDFYLRLLHKLNLSHKVYDLKKKLGEKELLISAKNYYINTTKAISIAKKLGINFYIVTLFDISDLETDKKNTKKEIIFFEAINKLTDENDEIKWINLKSEKDLIYVANKDKIFCDNIHFTTYGNTVVSKLIKDFINK